MGGTIYKALIFLKRRPGMTPEAFRDYYETRHSVLAGRYLTGATRYVRRYVEPRPNRETGADGELDFDVITELWFEDRAVWEGMLAFGERMRLPPDVREDEEHVFDRGRTRYAGVIEYDTELVDGRPAHRPGSG